MRELLIQGGPVLWVILVSGLAALLTFIERGLHLHRARIKSEDFTRGIINILKRENIEEALAICEETPGPVARVVRTAILNRHSKRDFIESAVSESGLAEISRLEYRAGLIVTTAQVAPMLGLLGTLWGLMALLGQMEATQWQYAEVVNGLKTALITSAAGLTVAIPCYAAYNLVVSKIEALVVDMERSSSVIVAFLSGSQ